MTLLDWLYERGGWGAVIAALAIAFAWMRDRALARAHARTDARATAVLLHSLIRRHGQRAPLASLPDEDDETSAVLHVRDVLQEQAGRELDSDVEDILRAYLRDENTPR